ncbi:MAG: hypothetical protein QXR60_05235, partial [Candidatus Nanoarchaeia archaeon]
VFFSLAFSTKFPMAAFLIFAVFILLEKYRTESLGLLKMVFVKFELKQLAEKINVISVNYKALFKNLVIGGVFYIAALLPPFEFSLKNLWFVYTKYKQVYPEISGLLKFNREFFYVIYDFIRNINVLDLLLFFFSIFIIFKLFFKRGKSLKEKFIFYLGIFGFLCLILFPSLSLLRVFFGFMIGLVFLMSFAFSNESYSIFTISKVKFKRAFFIIFIIIYIAYSFYNAYSTSPYFHYVNDIVCFADSYKCEAYKSAGISYYSASVLVSYLTPLLKEGETFYGINPIIHFYIKRSQHLLSWQFETAFKEQTGHDPDVFERVKYFHPNNESIRYIFVSPYYANLGKDTDTFKIRYEPNDIIRLKGLDIYYVYDMKNLRER